MVIDYPKNVKSFILDTQSILRSAKLLRINLDKDSKKVEFAANQLQQVVNQQGSSGDIYRSFMFSELESIPLHDKANRERIMEDTLISIFVNLETANLLLVAGAVCGESGKKLNPSKLDEAMYRLDNTIKIMDRSSSMSGRFGFQEDATKSRFIESPDLPSAIKAFREQSDFTLSYIISESNNAIKKIVNGLSVFRSDDLNSAFACLGGQMQELPQIGRLLGQGIEMIQDSIDAIVHLMGSEAIAKAKVYVHDVWANINNGIYLNEILEFAYDVQETKAFIAAKISSVLLDKNALDLDKARDDLISLETKFKESMAMMQGITSAATFGIGIMAMISVLEGPIVAFAASAYLLIFASIILQGMDYADSGRILQRIRGVREIAMGL